MGKKIECDATNEHNHHLPPDFTCNTLTGAYFTRLYTTCGLQYRKKNKGYHPLRKSTVEISKTLDKVAFGRVELTGGLAALEGHHDEMSGLQGVPKIHATGQKHHDRGSGAGRSIGITSFILHHRYGCTGNPLRGRILVLLNQTTHVIQARSYIL